MKASNGFKETIKAYLDKRASEDELFAIAYQKKNKNIEECCNYVTECAKKGGADGYADEEVFGWAVHYYDEDDIKNIKPIAAKVVINQSVALTQEDLQRAKTQAMNQAIEEYKVDAKKELAKNIELSDEDIAEAKKIAVQSIVLDQKEKMVKKAAATKKVATAQSSLFD